MIKYIGSKRVLVPDLVRVVGAFPELRSVVDLFSGTSRAGHAFKRAGLRVEANDHNAYAHVLARCYVEADRERVSADAAKLVRELNALPGRPGYFTETFCKQARYFQPKNGERIDAIRAALAAKGLSPVLEAVMLTSLMEAADRVDSTCGVQMAYVKKWATRSFNDLELRVPDVLPAVPDGSCRAHRMDANEAARAIETDIAYVDPPYNQHSYLGNYHVWETLVLADEPEAYGVAQKRIDCRTRKSAYNRRAEHRAAFADLIAAIRAPLLVVSFSDEGFLSRDELEATLRLRGEIHVIERDYPRYVGARIGIYNPRGEKVGRVSHLRNVERIYLVATEAAERLLRANDRLAALARLERPLVATAGAAPPR